MQSRAGAIVRLLAVALLGVLGATPAAAFTQSSFISYTFEGCRNDGSIVLPIGGQFVCPDTAYTTGNLGKGWNELDLVPHRLTTRAGTQAGVTTDYNVYVAADYQTGGRIGYDVLSVPVLNAAKSDASCSISAGGQLTLGSAGSPFGGGTDVVVYRELTVHQAAGSTCVFDWYYRLALGAHLYPGSSLQSYMFDQVNLSGGKRTVSIPVNEILPQELSKDMGASQGSDHAWSLTKEPTPASVSFGDVCSAGAPVDQGVTLTVTWEKLAAVPGGPITIITHVYAKNPAARTITVNVTDVIYQGSLQTVTLDTANSGDVDVAANTMQLVLTHQTTVDASYGSQYNDVATATYTDKVTGVPVPGTTQATATATVQNTGPELNQSASIGDVESITGTGLTFSVDSITPLIGGFVACTDPGTAYVSGQTTGPVCWNSGTQSTGGSVSFAKTIALDLKRIVSGGNLTDTAALLGSNGYTTTAGPINVGISSTATVALTIEKKLEDFGLVAGEYLGIDFTIAGTGGDPPIAKTLIYAGGGAATQSISISGLTPDAYTVSESSNATFYTCNPADAGCTGVTIALKAVDPQTVYLNPVGGVMVSCAGTATFTNRLSGGDFNFAIAKVKKLTLPDVLLPEDETKTWTFELVGPGGSVLATKTVSPNTAFVEFGVDLLAEGNYLIRETTSYTGWELISALLSKSTGGTATDTTPPIVCAFSVNYPNDAGVEFSCTFTNRKQGKAAVVKTVSGQPPSGTQSFTFQLRKNASTISSGTTLETLVANAGNGGILNFTTWLVPGNTYQMCEVVMAGWLSTLGTFVPDSFLPPDGVPPNPNVDNSILCVNFTVAAGETKTFTVDNSPPPGGRALTIGFWKNWASCAKSTGKQAPVLDQTMALAQPTGIQVGNLYLHGSTATPNVAPDCSKAVNLLNKSTFGGKKMASDPLFNMAAQLVAAELNLTAGAYRCAAVLNAIASANNLLAAHGFNGTTYSPPLTAAEANTANQLAKYLDDYNNNRPGVCP